MKHTKKLIPAIGMLLLSACMLVTSTFAWFSMNEKVTATGMSVMAKGNQVYLQITNDNKFVDGSGITTAAATNYYEDENDKLLPANVKSTGEGENSYKNYAGADDMIWVTGVGTAFDNGAVNSKGYTVVDTKDIASYALVNTFYTRLDPSAGALSADAPLYVKTVTVTNNEGSTATNFDKSVSVLIYNKTSKMGSLWGYTKVESEGTTTWKWECLTNVNLTADDYANTSTSGDEISVYVFFNGDHETCTLANLAKAQTTQYTVAIEFAVV